MESDVVLLKQKLASIRIDIDDLTKYLNMKKLETMRSQVVTCLLYLKTLSDLIIKLHDNCSNFGVDVFLNEFELIQNVSIQQIKLKTEEYCVDLSESDIDLIDKLIKSPSSYLEVDSEGNFVIKADFIELKPIILNESSFQDLDNYLFVGDALKDDEITNLQISEIRKLHLDYDSSSLSPFMTIIGPHLMGKTQSAFTLAHRINLNYINFRTIWTENENEIVQPISYLFEGFTRLFRECIKIDTSNPIFGQTLEEEYRVELFKYPLRTLGLLYVLMCVRQSRQNISAKDWFMEIINVRKIIIPCLTIEEFKAKCGDLSNSLLFVDEFPTCVSSRTYFNTFLIDLCRVVKFPCILTGSDSKLNDLASSYPRFRYRNENYGSIPWVQVMVKTPIASIKSIRRLVKVKNHQGQQFNLEKYILGSTEDELDYEILFDDIFGNSDEIVWDPFRKLFEFFIDQLRTSLPGMIPLFLNEFFKLIQLHKNEPKIFWWILNENMAKLISEKKRSLKYSAGLLATFQIIKNIPYDQNKIYRNKYLPETYVDTHLYRYGKREDTTFILNLDSSHYSSGLALFLDTHPYEDYCHFPKLNEDFFTILVSFNIWNFAPVTSENRSISGNAVTLAKIYQEQLNSAVTFITDTRGRLVDPIYMLSLAQYAIFTVSHQNMNGETGGKDVFIEFVEQLQPSKRFTGLTDLPKKLIEILDKIKVPYLLDFPKDDASEYQKYLGPILDNFMKFGVSIIPTDKHSRNLFFDLEFEGVVGKGYVECKSYASVMDYSEIFKYYEESCKRKYPMTFLICRELKQDESKKKINGIGKDLWKSNENQIEIYSVECEVKSENNVHHTNFIVKPIKTFLNPIGVFIVLESKFNPPHL